MNEEQWIKKNNEEGLVPDDVIIDDDQYLEEAEHYFDVVKEVEATKEKKKLAVQQFDSRIKNKQGYADWLKSRLTAYKAFHEESKAKSPFVRISRIKAKDVIATSYDEGKLIEAYPDFIKQVKPKLNWSALKATLSIAGDKVIDEDGQVVDGVSVEHKPAEVRDRKSVV